MSGGGLRPPPDIILCQKHIKNIQKITTIYKNICKKCKRYFFDQKKIFFLTPLPSVMGSPAWVLFFFFLQTRFKWGSVNWMSCLGGFSSPPVHELSKENRCHVYELSNVILRWCTNCPMSSSSLFLFLFSSFFLFFSPVSFSFPSFFSFFFRGLTISHIRVFGSHLPFFLFPSCCSLVQVTALER